MRLLALIASLIFFAAPAWGETCSAASAGNWSAITWTGCTGAPDSGDDLTLNVGSDGVVTVDVPAFAGSLTILSDSVLAFTTNDLTVTGNFDCTSSPGTNGDDGIDHPASGGAATLTVGGIVDLEFCDWDMNDEENLSLAADGGPIIYNTADSTQGADRQRYGFWDLDLNLGDTDSFTVRDVHGDTPGRDLTAHNSFSCEGTLTYAEADCAGGSCTWSPTIEVSDNTGSGVETVISTPSTCVYDLETLEVERSPAVGRLDLDFSGFDFTGGTNTFASFDFTGSGGTDNAGLVRIIDTDDGIVDFGSALVQIQKNGYLDHPGVRIQTTGDFHVPTGSGISGSDALATWDVQTGSLLVGGECRLGDDDMGGGLAGVGHLDAGNGWVQCGTGRSLEPGSRFLGDNGGRVRFVTKTADYIGADFFVSELLGSDANDGTTKALAKATLAACANLIATTNDGCFVRGGEVLDATAGDITITAVGGILGLFGDDPLTTDGFPAGIANSPMIQLAANGQVIFNGSTGPTLYDLDFKFGTGVQAEIKYLERGVTVTAPYGMHFSSDWSYGDGKTDSEDFHSLAHAWKVDEPGNTKTHTYGARARAGNPQLKTEHTGPIFAYLFENAGTFDVTLTVTDGTNSDTQTVSVTVVSEDTTWPAGPAVACFANTAGTFQGCPNDTNTDGACEVGTCTVVAVDDATAFDAAIVSAGCDDTGIRCLLARGDRFDTDGIVTRVSGGLWGAFGSGAKPIIEAFGNPGTSFTFCDTTLGPSSIFRVVDIVLQGDDTNSANGWGIFGTDEDCAISRVFMVRTETYDYETGIGGDPSGVQAWYATALSEQDVPLDSGMPDRFGLFESIIRDGGSALGTSGVDFYLSSSNGMVVDSWIGDKDTPNELSNYEEHTIRNKYLNGNLYHANRLGLHTDDGREGCGPIRHVATLRSGLAWGLTTEAGGTDDRPWRGYSRFFQFSGNDVQSCENHDQAVMIQPTSTDNNNEIAHTIVLDGNFFGSQYHEDSSIAHLFLQAASEVAIRNNGFDCKRDDPMSSGTCRPIQIGHRGGTHDAFWDSTRNRVVHNSFYNPTNTGMGAIFISVGVSGADSAIDTYVANNLAYDAQGDATMVSDSGTRTTDTNNTLDQAGDPFPSHSNPGTLADFETTVAPAGLNLGGLGALDVYDGCRYSDLPYQRGAYQDGSTRCLFSVSGVTTIFAPFLVTP